MRRFLVIAVVLFMVVASMHIMAEGQKETGSAELLSTEWLFALEEIEGSVQDIYAKKFTEVIKEKTNDEVNITLYYYGELGTAGDITELLQGGAVNFAFQSPGHLGSYVPEVQIFSLHYLLPSDEKVASEILAESPAIYNILGDQYLQKNLMLLDIITEGWQIWSSNKSLRTPEDFRGLKFRVMSSPMLIEAYNAYGANTVSIPYSEIYSALQLKQIDAQVQPYFAQQEMKFYEVQKYLTKADQLQFVATVAANPKFFNNLPKKYQDIVVEAAAIAHDYTMQAQSELNAERKEMMAEAKPSLEFIQLTENEKARFAELAKDTYEKYIEIGGPRAQELLDALQEEIAKQTM